MNSLPPPPRPPRVEWPIRRCDLAHLARLALADPPASAARALATYLVLVRAVEAR